LETASASTRKIILIAAAVLIAGLGGFLLYRSGIFTSEESSRNLPLIDFPKPFEEGYFQGLQLPVTVATYGDLEVIADEDPITFNYPFDPFVARTLLLKNNGSKEIVIEYAALIDIVNFDEPAFINHPQPPRIYLKPGATAPLRLVYSLQTGGPDIPKWKVGDTITVSLTLNLSIWHEGGSAIPEKQSMRGSDLIKVQGQAGPSFEEPEGNAAITGTVKDGNGKPLAEIPVTVSTGRASLEEVTDSSGKFRVPVYAHQRAGLKNVWSEFIVSVNPIDNSRSNAGYVHPSQVVAVADGETKDLSFSLAEAAKKAEYAVKKTLDIGLQGYAWDFDESGSVFATVPFHTNERPDAVKREANLTVFNSAGDLLWKYLIATETPTVDVSPDGERIATTKISGIQTGSNWGGKPIIFDREGNVIREFVIPATRFWWGEVDENISEVQLSNDSKYLAAGDSFGRLFLLDVGSGNKVWEKFVNGQVRKILFDSGPDYKFFVSSGDGYLRSFDEEGNLIWETYADAWATDMKVSENYILITTKAGRGNLHLIDKDSGETIWSYPVEQRGASVSIAPDESFLYFGTDIGSGSTTLLSTVFDISGNPLFGMGNTGQWSAITADSRYVLAKNGNEVVMYDRDGNYLWGETIATGRPESLNHILWVSPDATRIIVGLNDRTDRENTGQIYFLEGGIEEGRPALEQNSGPNESPLMEP